jgi:hypothetical protein
MTTYAPGVVRHEVVCEFCGANYWCAARIGSGVMWECAACGDLDRDHPLVEIADRDRTEEDL